jgi:hypothetical protein
VSSVSKSSGSSHRIALFTKVLHCEEEWMKAKRILPLALLPVIVGSGCATYGPTWSEVSGNRYNRSIMNREPALIENIDGSSYARSAVYPIKVDPGRHEIRMQGVLPGWSSTPSQTMTLTLEPCKRYYLNAQFENPVQPVWTPVVDYVEAVAGCPSGAR